MAFALPKKARKVIELLAADTILKFRQSPRGYFLLPSECVAPWREFHRKTLLYALRTLLQQGLITIEEGLDGFTAVTVSAAGRQAAARLRTVEPVWDRKWRLVLFDIPEQKKKSREAFRYHLRRMGFTEFRKSALLYPYPCADDVQALAERFDVGEHIALITAESLSNEFLFKKHFGLL